MPSLGYRAFETGVEGVAGEEGNEGSLLPKSRIGSVFIDDSLKARNSASWLRRSGSEITVVRIIKPSKAQVYIYSIWYTSL